MFLKLTIAMYPENQKEYIYVNVNNLVEFRRAPASCGFTHAYSLVNGYYVTETVEQIIKALTEMYVTIKEIPNDSTGTSSSIRTETSEVSSNSESKE